MNNKAAFISSCYVVPSGLGLAIFLPAPGNAGIAVLSCHALLPKNLVPLSVQLQCLLTLKLSKYRGSAPASPPCFHQLRDERRAESFPFISDDRQRSPRLGADARLGLPEWIPANIQGDKSAEDKTAGKPFL